MSLHPPAPSDLGELVDAYAQTVQNVIDLGRTMRPDDAARPTDCPGWTVLDQIAHVASTEAMVAGRARARRRRQPPHARAPRASARGSSGTSSPAADATSRRCSTSSRSASPSGSASTARGTEWAEREVRGPFGPTTWHDLLAIRTFDIWMHEQDVREALERPGGLDTGAAALAVSVLFAELPRLVAKDAAVEPGNAVVLDLTGPTVGRAGARVEEQDGKARGIPLFTGDAEEHPDVVTTSLTMSTRVAAASPAAGARPTTCTSWCTATTTSPAGSWLPWRSPPDGDLLDRQPLHRDRHRPGGCRVGRAHRPRPDRATDPLPALGEGGGRALGVAAEQGARDGRELLVHLPGADGTSTSRAASTSPTTPRPARTRAPVSSGGTSSPRGPPGRTSRPRWRSPSTCPSRACCDPR